MLTCVLIAATDARRMASHVDHIAAVGEDGNGADAPAGSPKKGDKVKVYWKGRGLMNAECKEVHPDGTVRMYYPRDDKEYDGAIGPGTPYPWRYPSDSRPSWKTAVRTTRVTNFEPAARGGVRKGNRVGSTIFNKVPRFEGVVGSRVLACPKTFGGAWWSGKITSEAQDGTFSVKYDRGISENDVSPTKIISYADTKMVTVRGTVKALALAEKAFVAASNANSVAAENHDASDEGEASVAESDDDVEDLVEEHADAPAHKPSTSGAPVGAVMQDLNDSDGDGDGW